MASLTVGSDLQYHAAALGRSAFRALRARPSGSVAKFIDMRVEPGLWDDLSRERIDLLRRTQFACHPQLTLTDHVHEFDAGESRRR